MSTLSGRRINFITACIAVLLISSVCPAQVILTPYKESGVYEVGGTVGWTVQRAENDPETPSEVTVILKKNGLNVYKEGTLDLSSGRARIETTLDYPGSWLLEIITVDPATVRRNGLQPGRGVFPDGALVSPELLTPSQPRPSDFDTFWESKLAELERIPVNPVVEPGDSGRDGVAYATFRLDNVNGTHVYGQMARPDAEGKYPALLILQWAGIYGLQKPWVVNRATNGWLAVNIEPHDIPGDRPPEYYRELQETLSDYFTRGNTDREESYFLRMYLGCCRAVDYITQLPEWDGKTIVVMGTSMGGQQSIVTAGLNPEVTALMPNVPSGCDVAAPAMGRASGFPDWAKEAIAEQNNEIYRVGAYFDPVNFASRITSPALVALGLFDETCPPAGVYTAYNQLKGPKEVLVMHSPHQDWRGSQAPYVTRSEEWLDAIMKTGSAPVK